MINRKEIIALADHISAAPRDCPEAEFTDAQISYLARFLKRMNPRFKENRWIGYIIGACGPNGGRK